MHHSIGNEFCGVAQLSHCLLTKEKQKLIEPSAQSQKTQISAYTHTHREESLHICHHAQKHTHAQKVESVFLNVTPAVYCNLSTMVEDRLAFSANWR